MRTIKFCSVLLAYTPADKNDIEASCHKQDSLMRGVSSSVCRINKCCCLVLHGWNVHDTQCLSSQLSQNHIWVENHNLPQFGGNIAIPFSAEKLEWCGYPKVKNSEDMFTHFDRIQERDTRRTDRQTRDNSIGHAGHAYA